MRATIASVFAIAVSALALPTPGDKVKRDGIGIVYQDEGVYLGYQASVSWEGGYAPYHVQVIGYEDQQVYVDESTDDDNFDWAVENIDEGTRLQYVVSDDQGDSATGWPFMVQRSPDGRQKRFVKRDGSIEIVEQTENVYLGAQAAVTWEGGDKPYTFQVIDGETQEVYFVESVEETAFEWTVLNIEEGKQLQVVITDSENAAVTSTPFVVR